MSLFFLSHGWISSGQTLYAAGGNTVEGLWKTVNSFFSFFLSFLKEFIYLVLERGERKRERNISVWLPLKCPLLGTWPAIQACALTGNQTSGPLVHRPELNPLSYTTQASVFFLIVLPLWYEWKVLANTSTFVVGQTFPPDSPVSLVSSLDTIPCPTNSEQYHPH